MTWTLHRLQLFSSRSELVSGVLQADYVNHPSAGLSNYATVNLFQDQDHAEEKGSLAQPHHYEVMPPPFYDEDWAWCCLQLERQNPRTLRAAA